MKSYKYSIHPALDQIFWPLREDVAHTTLMPPVSKRMPGRPKKNRGKEPSEAPNAAKRSSIVTYNACNKLGHNRITWTSIHVFQEFISISFYIYIFLFVVWILLSPLVFSVFIISKLFLYLSMASSDDSMRFMGENSIGDDPTEAILRVTGLGSIS